LSTFWATAVLQQPGKRSRASRDPPADAVRAEVRSSVSVPGRRVTRPTLDGTYAAGSKADFDRLYQDHYQLVFRTVFAVLGDLSAAEDCTQDAFLSAFKAWGRWKADGPPGAWLHRIAINAAISHQRRRRIRDIVELMRRLGPQPDPDPTEQADGSVLLVELRKLPTKQAAALVLRHLHGYTNREIAAALRVPESTVASRRMQARRTLRARLESRSDDDGPDTSGRFRVISDK
jgi:RNA polymerase sigma-70 factor (ECF subfamily)